MKPGEVVLVKFPFSSLNADKKRPALVLNDVGLTATERLITVAMVTSRESALKIEGDVVLKDWKESGLLHESVARMAKIATVDASLIHKIIGRLTLADQKLVMRAFSLLYRHWI